MAEAGTEGPGAVQQVVSYADPAKLSEFLLKTVSCFLEESPEGVTAMRKALDDPATREAIKKYITDPQVHSLIVQKLSSKGFSSLTDIESFSDEEEEGGDVSISFSILIDVRFTSPKVQRWFHEFSMFIFYSVVFIKRGASVEADKNFSTQLRFLNFTDGSPYETLHSMISNAISPFYKSYIRESGRADRFGPMFLLTSTLGMGTKWLLALKRQ